MVVKTVVALTLEEGTENLIKEDLDLTGKTVVVLNLGEETMIEIKKDLDLVVTTVAVLNLEKATGTTHKEDLDMVVKTVNPLYLEEGTDQPIKKTSGLEVKIDLLREVHGELWVEVPHLPQVCLDQDLQTMPEAVEMIQESLPLPKW